MHKLYLEIQTVKKRWNHCKLYRMCVLWKIVAYFVVIKHKFLLQELYL